MNTWKRIRQIQHKLASTPAALSRTAGADYTGGYFFVTLNVARHSPILGKICGRYDASTGSVEDAHIDLTPLGIQVQQCWLRIPRYYPSVQILSAVVMPEHFHGLLYLDPAADVHLGQIIRGFMVGCTHCYWDALGIPWGDMKQSTPHGVCDPRWEDIAHSGSKRGPALFVNSYNDTIPITPDDVATRMQYIAENPIRRLIKGTLTDRFSINRACHSANWNPQAIHRALLHDRLRARDEEARARAQADFSARLLHDNSTPHLLEAAPLCLDYVGYRPLLLHRRKLPLICHRADADRFYEQASAVMREARAGAVIVSAFISPRERDILQLLLQEQLPVIRICDNGFSLVYKPTGHAFYACAENRLLQITCWDYEYREDSAPSISRPQCLVMNELARVITGTPDDWWKRPHPTSDHPQ